MAMQTVIMAGGEGVRLRPLTQHCPKPLAPLCGEAVMGYTLQLLNRHGIHLACAALCYRPQDVIKEFQDGRHGVSLNYSIEDMPLGTAGSVRKATQIKETTLVLSGDGLTDCDLTQAIAFHKKSGAMATIVLSRTNRPWQYGVVFKRPDGRITQFIEKPQWSGAGSYLANTGIYLLEPEVMALIPQDAPYDFGRQLFPRMAEMNLPLYGYESRAYWCDVGDPAAFLRAQGDLLRGKTAFMPTDMGLRTLKDGYISSDSYVSPLAYIAPDARIENSCILPGARVDSGVRMNGSIICCGAAIGRGATLSSGSMLGAGAHLNAFAQCNGRHVLDGMNIAFEGKTGLPAKHSPA